MWRSWPRNLLSCSAERLLPILFLLFTFQSVSTSATDPATDPAPELQAPNWNPPLDLPLLLTSTFGEYRAGHFHAGIDLSTGGEIGASVRAVAAGRIVRLRASGLGYGRALYLETESGFLAVYAHLHRFSPKIESVLIEAQRRRGEYEADINLDRGIPVDRGEIIAWSGETGAGPPHLHFELRKDGVPINPLLLGMTVSDPDPPQLVSIRLFSLDSGGSIDGYPSRLIKIPSKAEMPPIPVWGEVGFQLEILDRAGSGSGRLVPLSLEIKIVHPSADDRLLARRSFKEASFERTREVERVFRSEAETTLPEVRMFLEAESRPDPAWDGLSRGVLTAAGEDSERIDIEIELTDAAGGGSTYRLTLIQKRPSGWITFLADPRDPGRSLLGEWSGAVPPRRLLLRDPLEASHPMEASAAAGSWWRLSPSELTAMPDGEWRLVSSDDGWVEGPDRWREREAWFPWADDRQPGGVALEPSSAGLVIWLDPPAKMAQPPRLRLLPTQGGGSRRLFHPTAEGRWWAALPHGELAELIGGPEESPGALEIAWGKPGSEGLPVDLAGFILVDPKAAGHGFLPGASIEIDWPAQAVYAPVLLRLSAEEAPESMLWSSGDPFPSVSLPVRGPLLDLQPYDEPLASTLTARMRLEEGETETEVEAFGIYRKVMKDWRKVDSLHLQPDGSLTAEIDHLGLLAILKDTAPPWIMRPDPPDGARLKGSPALLRVKTADAGLGFRPEDADMWLDGRPVLARYDPDADALLWEPEVLLGAGRHVWVVAVRDRAGLVSKREFSFLVEDL
ncbi:MAG: M23 family metallopeptidase [Candidatus Eisenbacteria bacterium]|uniref:M23 family metallopeptidase n=1 Tax=Eiseniibacteriota bacterium TaxID=2212470 RepID=A0A948RXH4_UNCEI|nr:M23 family metallopeptidase [Candidatus Eisenbacteria bacterium]MBU1950194.1 M23 family metallopeptidase [Candidatus Eisenbacteria bacterium]MBU2691409.1 M23 family metallopeptidase [Candidatus Eisenbacteria bacterium]